HAGQLTDLPPSGATAGRGPDRRPRGGRTGGRTRAARAPRYRGWVVSQRGLERHPAAGCGTGPEQPEQLPTGSARPGGDAPPPADGQPPPETGASPADSAGPRAGPRAGTAPPYRF